MSPRRVTIGFAVTSLLTVHAAAGATIVVGQHGSTDFDDIQSGINAAQDGDTVLVRPGTYVIDAPIDFLGKRIHVLGEASPAKTIVWMGEPRDPDKASVFIFHSGEDHNAVLEGFSIGGGRGTIGEPSLTDPYARRGGGILTAGGHPTLRRNWICSNDAEWGGGIYGGANVIDTVICSNAAEAGGGIARCGGRIERCFIRDNEAQEGGGIWCSVSSPYIDETIITRNRADRAGGISITEQSVPTVRRSFIVGNRGPVGGLFIQESTAIITNCTILYNENCGIQFEWDEGTRVTNSIIQGNEIISDDFLRFSITYCLLDDEDPRVGAHGNIAMSPRLMNPRSYDYRPHPDSPCIDRGDPDAPLDPDGTRTDIGAVFFDQAANRFVRGDANGDSELDITDPITVLFSLFGGTTIACPDAADADDSGGIDVTDPIYLLTYLFQSGPAPPAPFPQEGFDGGDDLLICQEYGRVRFPSPYD
jgi:hypothetical protein